MRAEEAVHQLQRHGRVGDAKADGLDVYFSTCGSRVLFITWLPERKGPANTRGWATLTSPPSSLWPWVLVPFPLMASVSALTLLGDSSLQHFGQQSVVLTDLQLLLLQSELDHNWSSTLSTSFFLLPSFGCISIQLNNINNMQKRCKCTHLKQKKSNVIQPLRGFKKTPE